jgi:trimeric autotransporter adhesin
MSTKTTFKRIALVTVAALGFGGLSATAPASASTVASFSLHTSSITVVGGSGTDTPSALVRIKVTSDTAGALNVGALDANETITARVTGVPTTVTAKTVAGNGGAFSATTTTNDLSMVEVKRASDTLTNWAYTAAGDGMSAVAATQVDTVTATGTAEFDGKIGSENTSSYGVLPYTQVATADPASSADTATSKSRYYYVAIMPRSGEAVIDQGVYTVTFTLTDKNGNLVSTQSLKIDFVSDKLDSGSKVTVETAGTFTVGTAFSPTTTTAGNDTYVKATLTNRDGGVIRGKAGAAEALTFQLRKALATSDTLTSGVSFGDAGNSSDFGHAGAQTLVANDGVYGLSGTAIGASGDYTITAKHGAASDSKVITVYSTTAATAAVANSTEVLVTAAGMSATDSLLKTTSTDSRTWTLPTTTKTATLKFTIKNSAGVVGGALITVTPTWSGTYGTTLVSPVGTAGVATYTTDALGNFSVTVTNSSPVKNAQVSLALTGGAAFGTSKHTAILKWEDPTATSIAVADPIADLHSLTGSTNVVTVVVKDQFGTPVSGQLVTVATAQTPTVASTTVIAPITTGAAGTASYSFTPAAASTSATVTFACAPVACSSSAVHAFTYKATLPVVATLTAYHGYDWGTADVLTPSTGIYTTSGGTVKLAMVDNRNLSKSVLAPATTDANDLNDQIALRFVGLTSAGVAATGALVTVTAGAGGHILDVNGLPVKSRTYALGSTGTAVINVLATNPGAITWTATSGTVTSTAAAWVDNRKNTDNSNTAGRFITVTSAATGTANGAGVPVTVAVTDRYGNPVSGVDLNVVASGVGSFMGGNITQSFKTDASGSYTFLANTSVSEGGVAKFTATTGTAGSFDSAAGYVAADEVDTTLAAGNSTASASITFAAGASAADIAQAAADAAAEAIDAGNNAYDAANAAGEAADAATAAAEQAGEDATAAATAAGEAAVAAAEAAQEAAAEATDAANAATDAANASAEAADAATAAAQDAADAVAALSTQVSEMITALKKQITALTNLVIKIQKKVKA